jgi:hypothetical protein
VDNRIKNCFPYFPLCVKLGKDPHVDWHPHFDANPDQDPDLDRHQNGYLDPDRHQNGNLDPDRHQNGNLDPDRHQNDADPQHFHATVPLQETCLGQTAMNSAMVRWGESPGFTRSKNSSA